ncbi:hypothetical protein CVT24_002789 [Panaeolus cyanescens]|uniref:J domain-containing protein n=1 Tax=Panaeolus cyanescens TaxID=181874 RepID=A0A409WCD9_9AGAR|nr:hypothetical protein CVT24_002789 [Panaeolus cyanescens]
MDDNDPITQFFPGEEDVDLYAVLSVDNTADSEAIKKAYRRLALKYHPDKQTTASDEEKAQSHTKFQQIGFAYAVLGDPKRKTRYDTTGKTDEGFELNAGEDGWEAYFEDLFDRVTRGKLDEMKKEYQGSAEEVADIVAAYEESKGSLDVIMTHIPHSTHEDEERFIIIISKLIKDGTLKSTPAWKSSSKDEKAKMVRKKEAEKEAKEAEALAKELGVWDEFYGSGKPAERKKGKGKKQGDDENEEDTAALQALILKKRKSMDSFFDGLASKYAEPATKSRGKGKKRPQDELEEEITSKKRSRSDVPPPPEIDDEEFEKLQKQLFGNKDTVPTGQQKKTRSRKAK